MEKNAKEHTKGLAAKKEEDFGEWFSQILEKAGLIDYTLVSGCYVYRPYLYAMWEKLQAFLDTRFKKEGVQNCYFPLFIPESLLNKEKSHVKGFSPEVAWVTHGGNSKLSERLAIRPTSETAMYTHFARWIQSHRDLPILINQWCNVVRWEFKNPVPLIRAREFLWQEGHTAHKSKEDADAMVTKMLDHYAEAYEQMLAVPVIKGRKTESEKFAGALYTTSVELFISVGKAAQGATSHNLGQNFAKAFEIEYLDEHGKKQHPWQTSWGFSTRSIGLMLVTHSDNKGLVLPPAIAPIQAVIVPILFEDSKEKVLKAAKAITKGLEGSIAVKLDDRDEYTPGWKFNDWELKGVPLRIEIGPKDVEKEQCVLVSRDNGTKVFVKLKDIKKAAEKELGDIQQRLYAKAKQHVEQNTVAAKSLAELQAAVEAKKLVKASWCESPECEAVIREKANGAKIICIPLAHLKEKIGICFNCGTPGKVIVYVAKSY